MLELRIHGVNNTPPHDMLDLQPGEADRVDGDDLGNFWRPGAAAQARLRPGHPGCPPDGVTREAYSWGALARNNLRSGGGALGTAAGAVTRLGWALLVPFGFVNVAFWSRRLSPEHADVTWQLGPGARTVRVVAAGLTLLLVGAACVVSLDLVASQCFGGGRACDALPAPFDGLADQPLGRRLALLTVVPLAVLALLALLASITRSRYEQLAAAPAAPVDIAPVAGGAAAGSGPAGRPEDRWSGPRPPALLATPGFWSNARLTSTQGRLHLAAGLAFIVLSSSWYAVVEPAGACVGADGRGPVRTGACLVRWALPEGGAGALAVSSGVAMLVLLLGLALLCWGRGWAEVARLPGPDDRAARPSGSRPPLARCVTVLLVVAAVTTAAQLVLLARETHGRSARALEAAEGAATPAPHPAGSEGSLFLLVVVLLPLALSGLFWRGTPRRDRPREMWGGGAPGVFLLLAVGVGLALTTFVVVGVGDWLNGDRTAGDLVRDVEATEPAAVETDGTGEAGGTGADADVGPGDRCPATCDPADPHLRVPAFFVWYGLTLLVGVPVFLVLAGLMAWRVRRDLPAAAGSPEDVPPRRRVAWGSSPEVARRSGARTAREAKRRTAGAAHRAEPAIALLAGVLATCLAAAVVLVVLQVGWPDRWPDPNAFLPTPAGERDHVWVDVVDLAAWGAGATALLVLGGLVGGAVAGRTRPLGLLWDLMCFLPRAGHPYGPPCYAERVVPELVRRYHGWLDGGPDRRVVVSAHSLGAVLAVASLLAVRVELGPGSLRRLALLTYGVQLRPYFGRIFPELLGPTVLGTAPGRGAQPWTGDPWKALVAEDEAAARPGPAADVDPVTVRGLLTGDGGLRWVSLWRRTDYLGFPADRYVSSAVDRPAEEVDTSDYLPRIGTHGGYTRVGAYRDALEHLLRLLR